MSPIVVTLSGITSCALGLGSLTLFSSTISYSSSAPSGNTPSRRLHPANAELPIVCRPSANFKRISFTQPENALLSMTPTLEAVSTSTRFVQPENALVPIVVVPFSPLFLNFTLASAVNPENAPSSIFVTVPGSCRLTIA